MNNFDQKFWGKSSRNYDSLDWINRSWYLDKFIQAGDFSNQDSVLDIGTGTGIIAFTVSPRVKGVIGIDASPEMLEHAQSKNQAPNVEFQIGDVRDLDFPDSSFENGGAKVVHGSGGILARRGRSKTLPPVAFDSFGVGRWKGCTPWSFIYAYDWRAMLMG